MGNPIAILLSLSACFFLAFCTAIDTITPTHSIKDPESIISKRSIFKLGFFSPNGSTNRYVGIWYNQVSVLNVIWVANRDKPLKDSSGVITISEQGNLLVLNGQNEILWSSNVSNPATNNTSALLLDSGNLVLQRLVNSSSGGNNNGRIIWESFEHPCNSFLPKMKIGITSSGEKQQLTSWKSPSDPSNGRFSASQGPLNAPEIFVWNGDRPYWRSGPWNGQIFLGIRIAYSKYGLAGIKVMHDKGVSIYITYSFGDKPWLTNGVLDSQGKLKIIYWNNVTKNWEGLWVAQETDCDVFGKCGAFGICNSLYSPICSCLRGFEPKNAEEWNRGNWTSGCVRKMQLQCERVKSHSEKGKEDGFLELKMIKVPAFAEFLIWAEAEDKCKSECLKSCSCVAYAYDTGIGCMSWSGNLIDTQEFSSDGMDLYLRVAYSEQGKKGHIKVTIAITVPIGTITIAICTYFSWMWMAKQKGEAAGSDFSDDKLQELPLFNFEMLATATNNFHMDNKLGQGGFGPVYKGKLMDGQEIAVKRLSRASGQGLEEFMNEVVVISKVQHRNLVRLLGCCVEGEEKMLVYEYMPNISLDAFLFDPQKQEILHWRKRLDIIAGVGRGLLYLHRDSRLRIIHRDLKASNILLDEELNPKISDFGMARIFRSNQHQADTRRVVGTYGYMSPEYAMEGRFSEKSDVFSFGVLLLEIVSGRRNSSFCQDEHSLTLLGVAWKLWNEDNNVSLIDPAISDQCFRIEILRCIHVGLLCVQEFATDRPTMSTVLSMLSGEIADLPVPKQPAFTGREITSDAESSHQSQKKCSINNLTVTIIEGR